MKPLVYASRSLEDLESILRYIARDDPTAATRFVDAIEAECNGLARSPGLGEHQEDLAPGLRRFCFRRYAIYYRELDDRVRIERVLHGAMDTTADSFKG